MKLFFILLITLSSFSGHDTKDATECVISQWYNGSVDNSRVNTYYFNVTHLPTIGITAVLQNNSFLNAPLLLVAKMFRGASTWTLPHDVTSGQRTSYNAVSKTLCLASNSFGNKESFSVEVSTASTFPVLYSLKAVVENKTLSLEEQRSVNVYPAEPVFLAYRFVANQERVLVKALSDSTSCAMLVVQDAECPSEILDKDSESVKFATMTTQSAITVERKHVSGDSFYIVVMVEENDLPCLYRNRNINAFGPRDKKTRDSNTPDQNPRRPKIVIISVEPQPNISDYLGPTMFAFLLYGMFYVAALIIITVLWCIDGNNRKSFIAYLIPTKVKDSTVESQRDQNKLISVQPGSSVLYGSACGTGDETDNATLMKEGQINSQSKSEDYAPIDEADNNKDIYRLKAIPFLSDFSKKNFMRLSKKFNAYYWNVFTISVFYGLPVIQLVLTYQQALNASGNQDICYYNSFCARPYKAVSAFNNIYSNIGYMMLGLLFVFLVMRRDRLSKQIYAKNPEAENKYGIPQHYGVMYTIGVALFMEGVMSSCYHVCPNYSNFQFDTAFMYMIGILACLRLYQCRHPDIFMQGHVAFTGLATVIFTSVIGVIFRSRAFWVVFMIFHLLGCFFLSSQLYYMGRLKDAFQRKFLSAERRQEWCSAPKYKIRVVLLILFNAVNLALSINGLVTIPIDFATYLLGIIIGNGLLYVGYYIIMKFAHGERIKLLPMLCIILAMITWGGSLFFFQKGLTNWKSSPAVSRQGNQGCKLFNFYDYHDLWHGLSAIALFFSFLAILSIDDGLEDKERATIHVF